MDTEKRMGEGKVGELFLLQCLYLHKYNITKLWVATLTLFQFLWRRVRSQYKLLYIILYSYFTFY